MRQLATLLLSVLALLFFVSYIAGPSNSQPFVSSEVQFSDGSASGLSIIPASCPSSPHYAGECGVSGGDPNTPPEVSGNACVIALSPSTVRVGGSAYMAWNSDYRIFNIPFTLTGTISPTPGSVDGSGVTTVSPSVTTTYSGTFTPTGSLAGIPESWLTPVTCSAVLTILPANTGPTNCSVQNFCVGQNVYRQTTSCTNEFIQACPFGCSNGVCLGAPTPTAFLRVRPTLVASGQWTFVEWSASQVSSCTVSGSNGDSWTGSAGIENSSPIVGQTTYTLTCEGVDGSDISRTATVNIAPIFNEN